ncbi:MAG: CerR family C-terminal domain-containing protein [Alphaproteobacteria bacterium]
MTRGPQETRARLLEAATDLFAERGFHGTGVREIALRAGVNVASANYHFGSKEDLYLEVLRNHFATIRARLAERRAKVSADELATLGRDELVDVLRSRVTTIVEIFVGPPPSRHARLMLRELLDPSAALPIAVEEFLRPEVRDSKAILSRLAPGLDEATVERCVFSMMAPVLYHALARPALLLMSGREEFPPDFAAELGNHVTAFSLGGLEQLARAARTAARR